MRGSEQRVSKRGECGAAGLDPAAIAQRVRQIAHDIREVLRKTHSSPRELIDLVERIDELRHRPVEPRCWRSIAGWITPATPSEPEWPRSRLHSRTSTPACAVAMTV